MQAANTYNTQTNSKAAQTQITRQTDGQTRRTAKHKYTPHNQKHEKNRHKPQDRQTGGRGEPPKTIKQTHRQWVVKTTKLLYTPTLARNSEIRYK